MDLFRDIIANVLLIAFVQGFILAFFVWVNGKTVCKKVFYLWLIILILSLNTLQAWMKIKGYGFYVGALDYLYAPWFLFVMPVYSLFIEDFVFPRPRVSGKFLQVAGIMFLGLMGLSLYLYFTHDNARILQKKLMRIHAYDEFAGLVFSWIILFYIIRFYGRYKEHFLLYKNLGWIKYSFTVGNILFFLWAVAIVSNYFFNGEGTDVFYQILRVVSALLIFWFVYTGLYRFLIDTTDLWVLPEEVIEGTDREELLFEKVKRFIEEKEIYTHADLTLYKLAQILQMHPANLSRLINRFSGGNLAQFINEFRVKRAQELLRKDGDNRLTMEEVGKKAGFSSRSNFYTNFKQATGITPKQFRDGLK